MLGVIDRQAETFKEAHYNPSPSPFAENDELCDYDNTYVRRHRKLNRVIASNNLVSKMFRQKILHKENSLLFHVRIRFGLRQ